MTDDSPDAYRDRSYRRVLTGGTWMSFSVASEQSDLLIRADRDLTSCAAARLHDLRHAIELYIKKHPVFLSSLAPLPHDPFAPDIVQAMLRAGAQAGVGPMAAVAGAIAESVGRFLLGFSRRVLVENGGDLFLSAAEDLTILIFAGSSPLSQRVALRVKSSEMPIGLCTSSATVGHSLSYGKADAVSVKAQTAALADAAATAIANRVHDAQAIASALRWGSGLKGVSGVVVIVGDRLGAWGDVELIRP